MHRMDTGVMMPDVGARSRRPSPSVTSRRCFAMKRGGVFRTLVVYTAGRRDIAEEAVAEAFARALAHRSTIRDPLDRDPRASRRMPVRTGCRSRDPGRAA